MTIPIRLLEEADLEAADAILKLAFQSPVSRLNDLRLYRRIQPDGWFAAWRDEHLVGLGGAANYGAVAHVGLMAVHPDAQRQGVGLTMMQFLLASLERQQVPLVSLDASTAGRHLYASLGFIPYDETCVFVHKGNSSPPTRAAGIQDISVRDLDELVQWDTGVFGADRRKLFHVLLEAFPGRACLQRDENGRLMGYLFAQRTRIGPWVMLDPQAAETLLDFAMSLPYEGTPSLTVPSVNRQAVALLQRRGFKQMRANLHMGRGAVRLHGDRRKVYSQTSLAVG